MTAGVLDVLIAGKLADAVLEGKQGEQIEEEEPQKDAE